MQSCRYLANIESASGYGKKIDWRSLAKHSALNYAEKISASHVVWVQFYTVGAYNGAAVSKAYHCKPLYAWLKSTLKGSKGDLKLTIWQRLHVSVVAAYNFDVHKAIIKGYPRTNLTYNRLSLSPAHTNKLCVSSHFSFF